MLLSKLYLSDFRSFEKKLLEFSPDTTVIVGPNTSGKTNILEAIYLLSTGKSYRARVQEEMIAYDEEIARVKGLFRGGRSSTSSKGSKGKDPEDKDKTTLEVILTRGEITVGDDPEKTQKVAKKRLKVNDAGKRLTDFAGIFKTVTFGPWDLDLVTESPSTRRDFLDNVISQVDKEYRRANRSYSKGLRQRNKLLYKIREEGLSRSQLLFWDKLLIKNGNYISDKRAEFIEFANDKQPIEDHQFSLEYDKSAISEGRLEQYANEEVAAATTLVGPHRDDVIFKIQNSKSKIQNGRELARFGSRGEQRMGVLWIKLAELAYIEEESGEKPTLLLDDIFSELDHEHRKLVMDVSKGKQTIITTADEHYIEDLGEVEKIELEV